MQGDAGEALVISRFPEEWVVRKLNPDFGLDLHVEVFELVDCDSADTRGEHFYVQVKSTTAPRRMTTQVRHRGNVVKSGRDEQKEGDPVDISVVACPLETSELLTVEALGHAVPVLLCLADVASGTVWYVCLNDYISKVLLPRNPRYTDQDNVTVHIPAWNVLDSGDPSFTYIWLLARRPKLYSAFNTFAYQYAELRRAANSFGALLNDPDTGMSQADPDMVDMVRVFVSSNLRLDIWETAGAGYWSPLSDVRVDFERVEQGLAVIDRALPHEDVVQELERMEIAFLRAVNLGRMYEELVREWRLPTALATLMDDANLSKYPPSADSSDDVTVA